MAADTAAGAPLTPAPLDTAPIVNTPTLVMGPSGSGKSSLFATLMEWLWEHYHAISFYYSFDGGGFPTQVQALIHRGICRLWRVQTRSAEPPASIHRAAMGYWPAKINPLTGETDARVVLVPPVTTVYTMHCPNGHVLRTSAAKSALTGGPCPTCGIIVNSLNARVTTTTERTKGFPERRACFYDGLTGAQDWFMEDIAKRNLGGEKGAIDAFTSDDLTFATASRAKIGSAQSRAQEWVKASANIPGLVVPAVWSALTQEASEEGGLTVVGPSMAGNAKTPLAPAWFGSTIEAAVVRVNEKQVRRIYFHQFVDERGRRHLCRVGAYPGAFEPYWEEVEGEGAPFRAFNLGLVHQRLTDARKATEAAYGERYADAPGMPAAEAIYGSGDAEERVTVPPAQGGRVASPPPGATALPPNRPGPPAGVKLGPPVQATAPAQPAVAGTGVGLGPNGPAPPSPSSVLPAPSQAASGPLPPATIGPPKAPVAAPPPGRKPQ